MAYQDVMFNNLKCFQSCGQGQGAYMYGLMASIICFCAEKTYQEETEFKSKILC